MVKVSSADYLLDDLQVVSEESVLGLAGMVLTFPTATHTVLCSALAA